MLEDNKKMVNEITKLVNEAKIKLVKEVNNLRLLEYWKNYSFK